MSNLHNSIMELCKKKGISGYRLCKEIGMQPSILSDLKMGRQQFLSARNMEKVASYFGVSVEYLLGKAEKLYTGNEELLSAETLASLAGEENKKPADQKASGLRGTGYDSLTAENRAVIDALIETLLKSQSVE